MSDQLEWDIYVSMLTLVDADGFYRVQINAEGEQESGVAPAELHHMGGFIYRPLDPVIDENGEPDATQSAKILHALEGGTAHAWCLDDPRSVKKLPVLRKGEAAMYGAQGNFFRTHADGSLTMMTSDDGSGTATGNAIFLRVRPTQRIFQSPWGTETFDYNGYHLRCKGGARIDAGFLGGMPAPFDALTSYVSFEAHTISLKCSVLKLGPKGPSQSMALMLPLTTAFANLFTHLTIVQASLAASATTPAAIAAAAASQASLQALTLAMPALLELMASKSLQGS